MTAKPQTFSDGSTVLQSTWADAPGFWGWLTTIDHKRIGRRYIATAFVFFVLGGILALAMRTQLARPENGLMGPNRYNQLFSMHGTTMMFLFAVPIMEAVAVYIIPLMVGTRNIAFPRLNAFSYWIYLAGGIMIWIAFAMNVGPEAGWFSYVPLASSDFSPGKRTDFWAQMITFTEVSALAIAVELVATILKARAPGMTLARMPLFVWSMLVTSFMVIFAMPAVMLSSTFLIADRLVGTHFYNVAEGGDALLWQHLFWFFGHPEVYIIFLPALGMVSSIIETFSRRPVFAHTLMVLALIATGFFAFGLWVHHMFATGLPALGNSFYTAASMVIAIPSGVQIFSWIATIGSGRPYFATPLLFVLGFFAIFVLGGLTGVMLASVPLDLQVHDTYFVVAHFHYVLIGGSVFPLFGAFYYWFPKFTGRMLDEKLGKWNFWLFFVGFNVTFFPMHYLGLIGMPRRVYTYQPGLGWDLWNFIATIGAYMIALSVLLFIVNVVRSLRSGRIAGDNPWHASTLEWATSSPPPTYNFAAIPCVDSLVPLW
jgi:cytochrome c oxidase subunit I+III